jgi:hypothetical protein
MKNPKTEGVRMSRKIETHYLLSDRDLLKIENLIDALNLAVMEICDCRKVHAPENDEQLAVESFNAHVEMVHEEARLRLGKTGTHSGDF